MNLINSRIILLFCLSTTAFMGCSREDVQEKYKTEILNVEKEFADFANREGVKNAFLEFAAEDAVLYRDKKIIKGKQAIREYFEQQSLVITRLTWTPDLVTVAASGDLAYTYGKFRLEAENNQGRRFRDSGYFHTVWKRMPDGSWRYVWD